MMESRLFATAVAVRQCKRRTSEQREERRFYRQTVIIFPLLKLIRRGSGRAVYSRRFLFVLAENTVRLATRVVTRRLFSKREELAGNYSCCVVTLYFLQREKWNRVASMRADR